MKNQPYTLDEYAALCLMHAREDLCEVALARLRSACPDCGSDDLEDNGATGDRLAYMCTACRGTFEPERELELEDPRDATVSVLVGVPAW